MYKYWGFGLSVSSAFEFPELLPATSVSADVTVLIGEVPTIRTNTVFSTGLVSYELNDDEMVFTVNEIATYYVGKGKKIIIHPCDENVNSRLLRMFVLSVAMTGILLQRQQMPMHAAAIVVNEKLTLIAGESGAGKSTSLTGLDIRGYRIFSDDVTVLKQIPGNVHVRGVASYPMIKLWEHTMQTMQLHDRSFPVIPGIEKYGLFFHDTFDTQSYPISNIILLEKGAHDDFRIQQLHGSHAFTAVVKHVFKPTLCRQPADRATCFKLVSKMVQDATVYTIARPADCEADRLVNTIISLL